MTMSAWFETNGAGRHAAFMPQSASELTHD
jgi:hypothetical protein